MLTFNFKAILSRWAVKKDEGALQKRSDFVAIPAYIVYRRLYGVTVQRIGIEAGGEIDFRLPVTEDD